MSTTAEALTRYGAHLDAHIADLDREAAVLERNAADHPILVAAGIDTGYPNAAAKLKKVLTLRTWLIDERAKLAAVRGG